MPSFPPSTTVFNDAYIAEAYDRFRRDPSAVEESWRQFFRAAESLAAAGTPGTPAIGGGTDEGLLRKTAGAAALVDAIRQYGHLAVPNCFPNRATRSVTTPCKKRCIARNPSTFKPQS